jgi:hypothetical protein
MMTLIAAAAVAAAQPAPAPAAPMAQHHEQMQRGQDAGHKDMDCCKECCKDMAGKHEGCDVEHAGHSGR